MTGSKTIGERAGDVASLALPVVPSGRIYANMRPSKQAMDSFVDAIGGKDKIPAFLAEYTSNPRLAAIDVSEPLLQTTQKLATTTGAHQNLLSDVVAQRTGTAKGAVRDAMDAALGNPVDVKATIDRLQAKARETGKTLINPVVAGTPHTEITDVIKAIDKEIGPYNMRAIRAGKPPVAPMNDYQQHLLELRNDLRYNWPDRDQMFAHTDQVHEIQSKLREKVDTLKGSINGSDQLLGGKLSNFREKLIDAIDNETGGKYKPALKQYRDDKQVEEAFYKGQEILKNRATKNEDDPSYWADWIKNASAEEKQAAKEGARRAVDMQVRGMRNAVGQKGTEIPQIDFNQDKLSLLFGKKEVEEMAKLLKDERRIAESNNALFKGSQTAMRMKSDLRVHEPVDEGLKGNIIPYIAEGVGAYTTGLPGVGAAAYKATDLAKRHIVNPITNKLGSEKNLELSRLATATGPEKDALIQQLSNMVTPPKMTMLSKVKSSLPTRP